MRSNASGLGQGIVRLPMADRKDSGMTLVEAVIALMLMGLFLLGFLGTFIQSRKSTESSVMDSAATALVYGMVEQMKGLAYDTALPVTSADPDQVTYDAYPGGGKTLPYIRVRLNQDQMTWLQCTYNTNTAAPAAPATAPADTSGLSTALCNTIGPLAMSSVAGSKSQALTLKVWVWVDSVANTAHGVTDAKCVTVIYSYDVNLGSRKRQIVRRETFVRAPLFIEGTSS